MFQDLLDDESCLWGVFNLLMVTDSLVSSLIPICRTLDIKSIDIISEKINPSERNLWPEKWQTLSALVSRKCTQVALLGSFSKYFAPQFLLMYASSCIRVELVHGLGIRVSHDHQSSDLWWEKSAIFPTEFLLKRCLSPFCSKADFCQLLHPFLFTALFLTAWNFYGCEKDVS